MIVTLKLSSETAQWLREKAVQNGQTLEAYLQQMVERDTQKASHRTGNAAAQVSSAEFERRLDELSEGFPSLPTLPADWSRTDLHADHD